MKHWPNLRLWLAALFAAACLSASTHLCAATPPASASAPHLRVSLVSEQATIAPGQDFWLGLDFQMDNGWHVYWINPGDSGEPPHAKWTVPAGVQVGAFQWPRPERINISTLTDYGYNNAVLLMSPAHTAANFRGHSVEINAAVDWLVCREVCIPGKAQLGLQLPVGNTVQLDPSQQPHFEATRKLLPRPMPASWSATSAAHGGNFVISLHSEGAQPTGFFPLQPEQIANASGPGIRSRNEGSRIELKKAEELTSLPTTLQGLVVMKDGASYVIDAPMQAGSGGNSGTLGGDVESKPLSALAVFGGAFLGGVILNLMPCVFPVLSLKVLGLVALRPGEAGNARRQALAYAAGILVSFWVLVAALLIFRAAGRQVGWGFQMQSPGFVACLAALFLLLALNMAGVFEVGMSWMGIGSDLAQKQGYAGSFFTGVLATVVATPCTAPFMGAAVGFALAQPAVVNLLIFTLLGLGLAFPYVLLSWKPGWARVLPKPGRWMEGLKQFMAFPLLGAVLWLVWVFSAQRGADAAVRLLAGLLLIGLAAWLLGFFRGRNIAFAVALALIAAGLWLPLTSPPQVVNAATPNSPAVSGGIAWEAFSPQKVEDYRKQGRPVFVDFTAAWCLSCQVNERAVFHSSDVLDKLKGSNVAMLRADWTSYDPVITATLQEFGRSGVPFYLLYSGDGPPQPLPELLTPSAMMEALAKLPPPSTAAAAK